VPGFVAILFYKDLISLIALWYCMALCISSITQTALIVKNNQYIHFRVWETTRLLLFSLLLPWVEMQDMTAVFLLILYFIVSLSYRFYMENIFELLLIKKPIKHEKP
jgi:hypothetical protein